MPLTLPGWLQQEFATLPQLTPWLFGLALLISASGFYRTVYFVSIGYAFSIAAMAVTTLLVFRQDLAWFNLLQNVCLAVYGLRLGTYLLRREGKSSFSKERESITQRTADLTFGRKIPMWIGVSLLYVLMFSPSLFSLTTAPRCPGAGRNRAPTPGAGVHVWRAGAGGAGRRGRSPASKRRIRGSTAMWASSAGSAVRTTSARSCCGSVTGCWVWFSTRRRCNGSPASSGLSASC